MKNPDKNKEKGTKSKEVSEFHHIYLDDNHAAQSTSTYPSSSTIFTPAHSNVEGRSYLYSALTTQAVVQHQHEHATSTTNHDGMRPLQRFESDPTFPFQRFSSYNPIIQPSNSIYQPTATVRHEIGSSESNSLSYASTPSYTATPSYNSTSSVAHEQISSIQAQPEHEQYTYAQQATGYWNKQPVGDSVNTEVNLAEVGTQFDEDAELSSGHGHGH